MPTVEIVCLQASGPIQLPRYESFSCMVESIPRSHRAHFQPDFDTASGPIVHLANKEFQAELDAGNPRGWFANTLFDFSDLEGELYLPVVDPDAAGDQWWGEDQEYSARLRPEVVSDLHDLLTRLVAHSPTGGAYFSTDYQFGPAEPMRQSNYTVDSLLNEGQRAGIRWNCLYHLLPNHRAV